MKKLKRALQFARETKDEHLTLSASNLRNVRSWVDASHAVHPDMKSHAGGMMSLGTGCSCGAAKGQKLSAKAQLKPRLLAPMTACHKLHGHCASLKPKDTRSRTMSCAKTTRDPRCSRPTAEVLAESARDTLAQGVFSLPTGSSQEKFELNTGPLAL